MGGIVGRLAFALIVVSGPVAAGADHAAVAQDRTASPVRVIDIAATRHVHGGDQPIQALVAVYAGQTDDGGPERRARCP